MSHKFVEPDEDSGFGPPSPAIDDNPSHNTRSTATASVQTDSAKREQKTKGIQKSDTEMTSVTSLVKPVPFSGEKGSNPQTFLKRFECYISIAGLTDKGQQIRDSFRLLLTGPAELWADALDPSKCDTWPKFRDAFTEKYMPEVRNFSDVHQLYSRRQGVAEDSKAFVQDVTRQGMMLGASAAEITQLVIAGLKPGLRKVVIQRAPKTLEDVQEALELAELCSAMDNAGVFQTDGTYSGRYQNDRRMSAGHGSTPRGRYNRQNASRGSQWNRGAPPNRSFGRDQSGSTGNSNVFERNRRVNQVPRENTPGDVICWFCGRSGHMKRDCFSLRNNRRPLNQ